MYDYYTEKFNRLNRETQAYNNRNVDRFNPSTQGNYTYFDPYRQGCGCYQPKQEKKFF